MPLCKRKPGAVDWSAAYQTGITQGVGAHCARKTFVLWTCNGFSFCLLCCQCCYFLMKIQQTTTSTGSECIYVVYFLTNPLQICFVYRPAGDKTQSDSQSTFPPFGNILHNDTILWQRFCGDCQYLQCPVHVSLLCTSVSTERMLLVSLVQSNSVLADLVCGQGQQENSCLSH